MRKQWIIDEVEISEEVKGTLEAYSDLEKKLLISRGIYDSKSAQEYLKPEEWDLPGANEIPGMAEAAQTVLKAIAGKKKICIYGDYDTDGITSVSILVHALKTINGEIMHYLPDRFQEGYGLNIDAILKLKEQGVNLIITVDCGIRAIEEVEKAYDLGLEMIIVDHHEPGDTVPEKALIVDPKIHRDTGIFTEYCGAGLSYLLAKEVLGLKNIDISEDLLGLAAVGTVADMVPLKDINRAIVAKGINALKTMNLQGMKALYRVARINAEAINAATIGFMIAPRLNATGRISDAAIAVELLLTSDPENAETLAEDVEKINSDRRQYMNEAFDIASKKIEKMDDLPKIIILSDKSFSEGVVGLAASRIKEKYYRPVLVGAETGDSIRASARSIEGFNMIKALEKVSKYLTRYGGHAGAAGLTVAATNYSGLKKDLELIAEEMLQEKELVPVIHITAEVDFNDLNRDLIDFLNKLEPFGMENERPFLVTKNVRVLNARVVGSDKSHLKLTVEKDGRVFDAIAFRQAEHYELMGDVIDIVYRFDLDEYMGIEKLQLIIEDIRF